MNKLIVIAATLATVTLLSGCKHVVARHNPTPDVVVVNSHYHTVQTVQPVHYHRPPPRRHEKPVVKKRVVVVKPPYQRLRIEHPQPGRGPHPVEMLKVKSRSGPQAREKRHDKLPRREQTRRRNENDHSTATRHKPRSHDRTPSTGRTHTKSKPKQRRSR